MPPEDQRPRADAVSQRFNQKLADLAEQALASLPAEQRDQAIGRVINAFRTGIASARDPSQLYAAIGNPAGRASMARAIYESAVTGLYPGGPLPDVYLTPRKIQDSPSIVWFPSFRGLLKLVERSGWAAEVTPVFVGEAFEVKATPSGPVYLHTPDPFPTEVRTLEELRGSIVRAFPPTGGEPRQITISQPEILKRRARSDGFKYGRGNSVWDQWPLEMAHKTALIYAIKRGLIPTEPILVRALEANAADRILDTTAEIVQPRKIVASGEDALADALGRVQSDAPAQITDQAPDFNPLPDTDAEGERVEPAEGEGDTW